ncbi:MAG: znuB [Gammaproteobacteria bacterium]|jgi:zinc/manganese transport system permease protein|nr:znuB [Gammaproteobacteria bacterium]
MINFSILSYDFMTHAFIAGTFAAILAGVVGYFVILRNLSFAAHALGHIGFAGASGALLIALSPMTGQLLLTLAAAMGIGALGNRIYKSDMVIGIILSFSLGLGTLFLHFYHGYAGQASVILFGNLLGVSNHDLKTMFWVMIISLLAITLIAKRLLFASLEPELAEAKGISLFWLAIIFMGITSVAVTLASQVVGIFLVFTLLIGPAAIAVQWTSHFWSGIVISVVLAVMIVWMGIGLSYITDWPISFWISTLVFVIYLLSLFERKNATQPST